MILPRTCPGLNEATSSVTGEQAQADGYTGGCAAEADGASSQEEGEAETTKEVMANVRDRRGNS